MLDFTRLPEDVAGTPYTADTAMFAFSGAGDCGAMAASAASFQAPAELGPNRFDPETGVYRITSAWAGHIAIAPDAVELAALSLPAGAAIELPLVAPAGVTVWRNGAPLQAHREYQLQPSAAGLVIWLRDALSSADTLVVLGPGAAPP